MQRRPVLLALVTVLGSSASASARPIEDAADAALGDALVHGFDGIDEVAPTGAAFVVGDTLVTVEVESPTTSDAIGCGEPNDCQLTAYQDAPVTLTFDPPVAAVGLSMWYSVGPFSVEITGTSGTELLTDVTLQWQHPDTAFAGAADIGAISTVVLTASDYATFWDDLRIIEGGSTPAGVDLSLAANGSDSAAFAGDPFEVGLRVRNLGPGDANASEVVALPPAGTTIASTTPSATVTSTHASFDLATLAVDARAEVRLELNAPERARFSCDDSLRTIAIAHTGSGDTQPRNNIAAIDTPFDRSRAPNTEDCTTSEDDDCDGLVNCIDDDCIGGASCPILLPDLAQSPFPPVIPWIDVPDDPLEELAKWSDPWTIPAPPQECLVSDNHGGTVRRPPFCCGPRPGVNAENPSLFDWLSTCPPLDPNYKTAMPPVNARGFGTTAAGETIVYAITYENIGGSDAHDVAIIDVLSRELDDTTLVVRDEGEYDAAARTITWIDPVLPPHEPRTVQYSIEVRDDAPVGTRVQNVATIVFPDAEPPTRIDTPPVVHTIPVPGVEALADLRIASCEPQGDGSYAIAIVNTGFAFAYDATATIVEAPVSVTIEDGECAFAHPDDEITKVVLPWSTTPAIDEVRLIADEDPCADLVWEILYYTSDGEQLRVQSRLELGPPPPEEETGSSGSDSGSAGVRENEGDGCSCRSSTTTAGGAWLLLLPLLGWRRRSGARNSACTVGAPPRESSRREDGPRDGAITTHSLGGPVARGLFRGLADRR